MRFTEPRRTASSVLEEVCAGLSNGSIVLGNLPASSERTLADVGMSIDADVLPAAPLSDPSQLGGSIHIKGEIVSEDDMRIDGAFEGLLQLENSKLTIGPGAKVRADIIAREVVVYGTWRAIFKARDALEFRKMGSGFAVLIT